VQDAWNHLNVHFHMLLLDGSLRFRWVKSPGGAELVRLTQTLVLRIGRFLERQGLLERDVGNSCLAGDGLEAGPMGQLRGSSIAYRIAVGPQQGRKVFTLQTLPACEEPFDNGVGQVAELPASFKRTGTRAGQGQRSPAGEARWALPAALHERLADSVHTALNVHKNRIFLT
jgi:hypothetical protein